MLIMRKLDHGSQVHFLEVRPELVGRYKGFGSDRLAVGLVVKNFHTEAAEFVEHYRKITFTTVGDVGAFLKNGFELVAGT